MKQPMIRSNAISWPPRRYLRKFHRRILELRLWLVRRIEIIDGVSAYRFRCETVREFNRCLKLLSKEPGTLDWITSEMKPGHIFFDVGANIGVYTILAARQVAPGGRVYAFEPHGPNFARLIDNITCNSLQDIVVPCSFALSHIDGYMNFNYESLVAGTSQSQLTSASALSGPLAGYQIAELKHAASIDQLIASGRVDSPHHVKIDVDGTEYLILQGMAKLLGSPQAPLTLQIELNKPHAEAIQSFLQKYKYSLIKTHYSRSAVRRMAMSDDSQNSGCNGIFKRCS
jgi:FkbM family methyltransferase